jgi:hypothetical protein
MADEPDEVLELTEDQVVQPETEEETNGAESKEEVVVSLGTEAAPASEEAPEWVRDLRKRARELERENAELKKAREPQAPVVGEKPTLAGCDYEEERFESELDAWKNRKSEAEKAQTEARRAQAAVAEQYQAKVKAYGEQKDTLGVADFEDAEAEVLGALNQVQQSILIHGAENKATLVYALGRHPQELRKLAQITDPIEFAFAAGRLEKEVKMERRKVTTSPESEVRGSAPLSGMTDKTLERLEAEAVRTGDRTKVVAYKRQLKAKGH